MAELKLTYPSTDDAPDVEVFNDNFKAIEENYNNDVAKIETIITEKVNLLYQIMSLSYFSSDVSTLFTNYDSASTTDEKVAILKQIANELAVFSSDTATVFESLNSL